jgi:pimeloyl-ACP methyl ester carboxylesterase
VLLRFGLLAAVVLGVAAPGALAAPGDFAGRVQIAGGRWMYIECHGRGGPTVVLDAGLRSRGDYWSARMPGQTRTVLGGVRRFTRVCLYDRPGTTLGTDQFSRSDPAPMPRTAADAARDLGRLLRGARVPGPYVLVGHSTAGVIDRLYAAAHPRRVAGLVQVDSLSEYLEDTMTPAQVRVLDDINNGPVPGLEGYKDLEQIGFVRSFAEMRRAARHSRPLRVPTVVISRTEATVLPDGLPHGLTTAVFQRAWERAQRLLAARLPGAVRVLAHGSGHYVMFDRPGVVIRQVRRVVRAARAGRHRL